MVSINSQRLMKVSNLGFIYFAQAVVILARDAELWRVISVRL